MNQSHYEFISDIISFGFAAMVALIAVCAVIGYIVGIAKGVL